MITPSNLPCNEAYFPPAPQPHVAVATVVEVSPREAPSGGGTEVNVIGGGSAGWGSDKTLTEQLLEVKDAKDKGLISQGENEPRVL